MTVADHNTQAIVSPDVYGNSPFEHELTAEPTNTITVVARPAVVCQPVQRTVGAITMPAVPSWMHVQQSGR